MIGLPFASFRLPVSSAKRGQKKQSRLQSEVSSTAINFGRPIGKSSTARSGSWRLGRAPVCSTSRPIVGEGNLSGVSSREERIIRSKGSNAPLRDDERRPGEDVSTCSHNELRYRHGKLISSMRRLSASRGRAPL